MNSILESENKWTTTTTGGPIKGWAEQQEDFEKLPKFCAIDCSQKVSFTNANKLIWLYYNIFFILCANHGNQQEFEVDYGKIQMEMQYVELKDRRSRHRQPPVERYYVEQFAMSHSS